MTKSTVKTGRHLVDIDRDDPSRETYVEDLVSAIEDATGSKDGKILVNSEKATILAELARGIDKVFPTK